MRILVVDDAEDGRDIAEAVRCAAFGRLQQGAPTSSAWEALPPISGVGGLRRRAARPVDLVLLDIVMPEMDGIEACARIHKEKRYFDIPIIMVTSLADVDSLANAFVAGATDYITKPVNRDRAAGARAFGAQAQVRTRPAPGARARAAQLRVDLGRPPRLELDRRNHRAVRRRGRRGLPDGIDPFPFRRRHLGDRARGRSPRRLSIGAR